MTTPTKEPAVCPVCAILERCAEKEGSLEIHKTDDGWYVQKVSERTVIAGEWDRTLELAIRKYAQALFPAPHNEAQSHE